MCVGGGEASARTREIHTTCSPSSSSSASSPAPDPFRPLFSQDGWAALHWAAGSGHTGAVEVLLKAKANVNLQDNVWVPGACFGME